MGLTLKIEQRLEGAGLIAFFNAHKAIWLAAAQQSHDFIDAGFPEDATIRRDDVRQALFSLLDVHKQLRQKLVQEGLKQNYWISYFTDLVIAKTWHEVHGEDDENEAG